MRWGPCFGRALKPKALNVKLSKHALARIQSRNLNLDHDQVQKTEQGCGPCRARDKDTLFNGRQSLCDQHKSTVIVTASDQRRSRKGIYQYRQEVIVYRTHGGYAFPNDGRIAYGSE